MRRKFTYEFINCHIIELLNLSLEAESSSIKLREIRKMRLGWLNKGKKMCTYYGNRFSRRERDAVCCSRA